MAQTKKKPSGAANGAGALEPDTQANPEGITNTGEQAAQPQTAPRSEDPEIPIEDPANGEFEVGLEEIGVTAEDIAAL